MPQIIEFSNVVIWEQNKAIRQLEKGIYKLRLENDVEKEYIYQILDESFSTYNGPAMVAVAQMKDKKTYVLYSPEYLTDKQLKVFEYLLCNLDNDIHIRVLTSRDYEVVTRCLRGKCIDVKVVL